MYKVILANFLLVHYYYGYLEAADAYLRAAAAYLGAAVSYIGAEAAYMMNKMRIRLNSALKFGLSLAKITFSPQGTYILSLNYS